MAKTGYKRFKKQERAKVKLKGHRTLLPKGQNVTDTSFKVKKIIVKEQLKEHGTDELLTKKHLSIKEVISRLSHHNAGMRQEALSGLQELAGSHTDLIRAHLSPLLPSCLALVTDIEADVRSNAVKLLSTVFHTVSESDLSPVLDTIECHLVCAMTHIEPAVRSDALRLLDALLSASPGLAASRASALLPRFLDLVSHQGGGSSGPRTLSLHLDGRVTSDVWRAKVIARLNRLFQAVVEQTSKGQKGRESCRIVKWSKDHPTTLELYSYETLSDNNRENDNTLPMKEYAETLMPLLLDAFIEAVPKQKEDESQDACVVGIHTVGLLQSIVEVILHIWELLKLSTQAGELEAWFKGKWGESVASRLLKGRFPYSAGGGGSRKRKRESDQLLAALRVAEPSCRLLNLRLCLLAFLLTPPGDLWARSVRFVKNTLRGDASLRGAESELLCQCLGASCQAAMPEGSPSLLSVIIKSDLLNSVDSSASLLAFEFLAKIAFQPSHILHKEPDFLTWLDSLPGLLCRPAVPLSVVRTTAQLAACDLPALNNSLDGWIEEILGKVSRLKVSGDQRGEGRLLIVGLVYWVTDWDQELISNIREILQKRALGDQLTDHLLDVLTLKAESTEDRNLRLILNEI